MCDQAPQQVQEAQSIVDDAWREVLGGLYTQQNLGLVPERLPDLSEAQASRRSAAGMALLARLNKLPGTGVAIATGDWLETTSFKLAAAGIDVSGYPMATSSDCSRRSEIIKLAARRAGRSLTDVIYVGDGVWDFKACCELGVRFVGTGTRPHLLKAAGAKLILEILEEALFLSTVRAAAVPELQSRL